MKLKYIIPAFMAVVAAVFTGCSDDNDPTYLSEVTLSQSYVAIPQDGGSPSITINASADWAFVSQTWIAGKDTTVAAAPKWLTVTPTSGSAGQTEIKFSAESTLDGRSCELMIECAGKTQRINVIQGLSTVSNATCAEVLAGPDSKTYRVTGTVTGIANTTYGNWYLNDGTGEIYIYGTLDAKGGTKNFLSWGLEVGDEVTVEGPKTTYNGTVELVDVTVININKSLIKVDSLSTTEPLPVEGGEVMAYVSCKGDAINVEIPENAKSWLSISAITGSTVTFRAAANEGGDRSATITMKTHKSGKEYTSNVTIEQKGAIVAATVAEFLAAEVGTVQYRMTGVITELYKSDKQGKSFYIADYSGKTLVYRAEGFIEAGAKVGDIVTVVGQRGAYKDSPQMVSGIFEELNHVVTEVTIAQFNSDETAMGEYYMVSGTLDEIVNATYGNVYLSDGENRVYSYGCYPGYGATGDARKNFLATAGIEVGDLLTIIGTKAEYNGSLQISNGFYFSHVKPEPTE